jgi:hypothetical protein
MDGEVRRTWLSGGQLCPGTQVKVGRTGSHHGSSLEQPAEHFPAMTCRAEGRARSRVIGVCQRKSPEIRSTEPVFDSAACGVRQWKMSTSPGW